MEAPGHVPSRHQRIREKRENVRIRVCGSKVASVYKLRIAGT